VTISKRLEGEKVKLINYDNDVFIGVVGDYIYPEDNKPEGIDAIILDYPIKNGSYKYNNPVAFNSPDIKSIEIIQ